MTTSRFTMRAAAGTAVAFALAWLASAPVAAQWDSWPMKNVPRLANGKVDLNAPPRRTADGKKICDAEITFRVVDFPQGEFREAMEQVATRIGFPKETVAHG